MKNPVKVVMLPTESTSNVAVIKGIMKLEYKPDFRKNQLLFQHIYVTVSQDVEFIKEGDWVVQTLMDLVEIVLYKKQYKTHCRKIIATNDPKLNREIEGARGEIVTDIFPQLQKSFLKEFVANPDGDFEVEYETNNTHNQEVMFHKEHKENFFEDRINGVWKSYIPLQTALKINQDNTVNITSVEEKVYSLEERNSAVYDALTSDGKGAFNMAWSHEDAEDWIKENL